jgi:hypothetical protein
MACGYLYKGKEYTKEELEDYIKNNPQEFENTNQIKPRVEELNNSVLIPIDEKQTDLINNIKLNITDILNNKKQLEEENGKILYGLLNEDFKKELEKNKINIDNFTNEFNNELSKLDNSNWFIKLWRRLNLLLKKNKIQKLVNSVKYQKVDTFFTEKGNLLIYGITNNQKTRIPAVNKLLYRGIIPANYEVKRIFKNIPIALIKGKSYKDFIEKIKKWHNQDKINNVLEENKVIPNWAINITEEQYNKREDAWRLSNGLPQQHNTFRYIGRGYLDANYDLIEDENGEDIYGFVNPNFTEDKILKGIDSTNSVMGKYAIKIGKDDIGQYIQYNDRWDLDVTNKFVKSIVDFTQIPFIVTGKIYKALSYTDDGTPYQYYTHNSKDKNIQLYNDIISLVDEQLSLADEEPIYEDYELSNNDRNIKYSINQNIYLQTASNIVNPAIEELDNYLLDFLKNFNVKTKQFNELKSKLGVDALGATDVLNKLIWYVKNRNEETLPEESAHLLVALMGESHPDIKELLNNVSNWSEYQDIKKQYLPIYKDENKVKIEAVGKLIAKSLVKNYKANGLDKNKLQKALKNILNFIEDILNSLSIGGIFAYNEFIADHIAINVLSGNRDYIYKIKNLNSNLNAFQEIDNNPNAKKIITQFSSVNVKMTGSLAIAGTENIRRPEGQGIHDIDFKVKSFEVYNKEVLPKIPDNAVPAHYGWHKKTYSTFAYMIPLDGYRIEVLERKDDFSNGWITSYKLYNEKNKEIEVTQFNVMAVDFFVYKEGANQKEFDFSSDFIPASLVYEGKMSLGGKSNPYFFSRDKDQEDYVLRDPKSFIPFEKHIYYQLEDNPISDFISQKSQDFQSFQQSLNKPNTNPVLQDNQQEQVNKFAELQERLSNKEFLEGAKGAYEFTPALQELGAQEEYNDYIARVSLGIIKNPSSGGYNYTSQVKDIVYHGTDVNIDRFDKNFRGKNTGDSGFTDGTPIDSSNAFFFSSSINSTFQYSFIKQLEKITSIANVLNNLIFNYTASNAAKVRKVDENLANHLREKQAELVTEVKMKEYLNTLYNKYYNANKELGVGFLNQYNNLYDSRKGVKNLKNNKNNILNGNYKNNNYVYIYNDIGDSYVSIDRDGKILSFNKEINQKNITDITSEQFDDIIKKGEENTSKFFQKVEEYKKKYKLNPNTYSVVINVQNPTIKDFNGIPFVQQINNTDFAVYEASKLTQQAVKDGKDSVIFKNIKDPYLADNYGIFEPEQIHILSSKQDVQGFKEFVNNNKYVPSQKLSKTEQDTPLFNQAYPSEVYYQRVTGMSDDLTVNTEDLYNFKLEESKILAERLKEINVKLSQKVSEREQNKNNTQILNKIDNDIVELTSEKIRLEDRRHKNKAESLNTQIKILNPLNASANSNIAAEIMTIKDLDFKYVNEIISRNSTPDSYFNIDEINDAVTLLELYKSYGDITDSNAPHIFFDNLYGTTGTLNLSANNQTTLLNISKEAILILNKIEQLKSKALEEEYKKQTELARTKGNLTLADINKEIEETLFKDASGVDKYLNALDQQLSNELVYSRQIAVKILNDSLNSKLGLAEKHKIELKNAYEKAKPFLSKLKDKYGIKGTNYNMFRETDKHGDLTDGLIDKFNYKFKSAVNNIKKDFKYSQGSSNVYSKNNNKATNAEAIDGIIEYITKLRDSLAKEGLEAFDYFKLSEFYDNNLLFDFSNSTNNNLDAVYEQKLKQELGITKYNQLVKKAKEQFTINNLQFNNSKNSIIDYSLLLNGNMKDVIKYVNSIYNTPSNTIDFSIDSIINNIIYVPSNSDMIEDRYKEIENQPELLEFLTVLQNSWEDIRKYLPKDIAKNLGQNGIHTIQKNNKELLLQQMGNTKGMVKFPFLIKYLKDRIIGLFSVKDNQVLDKEANDKAISTLDIKSNKQSMFDNINLEMAKFNLVTKKDAIFNSPELVELLTKYTGKSKAELEQQYALNSVIPVEDLVKRWAKNTYFETQSFDLLRVTEYYLDTTLAYAARKEAQKKLDLLIGNIKLKNKFKATKTGKKLIAGYDKSTGTPIYIDSKEKLDNTLSQLDEWYERTILNKDTYKTGATDKKKHYTEEEKIKKAEIEALLAKGVIDKKLEGKLKGQLNRLGSNFSLGSVTKGTIKLLSLKALGWNMSAATTNFIEGRISNYIMAATGEFFDNNQLLSAENVTFGMGKKGDFNKLSILMNKYKVLKEQSTELQKVDYENQSVIGQVFNPYTLSRKTEWMNQSTVMLAMLMNTKIKDINGQEIDVNVFEALDEQGNLKSEYNNQYNLQWQEAKGTDYNAYKYKLDEGIARYHGNYDPNRGMMAKSTILGQGLLTMKTWFPAQIYTRFGDERTCLSTGEKFKGRYKSYTPVSAAIAGGLIGGVVFGPMWFAMAPILGFTAAKIYGVKSSKSMMQEALFTVKALSKTTLALWMNLARIKTPSKLLNKDAYKQQYQNELDARNVAANMAELSMILTMFLMLMATKGFFDDEDDEDEIYNISINKLRQLIGQATLYASPYNVMKFAGETAVWRFITDVNNFFTTVVADPFDRNQKTGKYKIVTQAEKAFVPKFLSGLLGIGTNALQGKITPKESLLKLSNFEAYAEKEFDKDNKWNDVFKSKEEKEKESIMADRASRREELKEEGKSSEEITEILKEEIPTLKEQLQNVKSDIKESSRKKLTEEQKEQIKTYKENLEKNITEKDYENFDIKINKNKLAEYKTKLDEEELNNIILEIKKEEFINKKIKEFKKKNKITPSGK